MNQQQDNSKPISFSLQKNIAMIHEILGESADLVKREFLFHGRASLSGVCFYTDGLVDGQEIERIIRVLQHRAQRLELESEVEFMYDVEHQLITNKGTRRVKQLDEGIISILSGDAFVLIDHCSEGLLVGARGWDTRAVSEPQTEQVVRGPRDGFTEGIRTNTALVRRRIRDPKFRIEALQLGTKSKTDINIAYIEGVVKEGLVEEVKKRLEGIEIDAILDSGYIEELIEDAPFSPFTTVQSTERPDKVAASILEGRVAIFVDNSPFVLIVPTYFWQYLQASDDYYSRYFTGSFFRVIRYLAFIISLTLPSLYVMLVSFHQEMIPTPLALTIASGREVVPFPVLLEAVIMEITFELMKEAGLRMPKPVGQAVSIVGSLVVGQAAVQAGIASPFMVIIIAITSIASFAIPNYAASFAIRLLRFPILIASGTLGLLGFAAMFTWVVIHALSLRSFGESYLAPAAPFQPTDQKDAIIRMPWWKMTNRPVLSQASGERVGRNQLPSPDDTKNGNSKKQNKKKGGSSDDSSK